MQEISWKHQLLTLIYFIYYNVTLKSVSIFSALSIYAFGQPSVILQIAFPHNSHLSVCSQLSQGSMCVSEVVQFVPLADDVKSLCACGPSHVIASAVRQFWWPFQRNAARWGEVKEHTLGLSNCLQIQILNFSYWKKMHLNINGPLILYIDL